MNQPLAPASTTAAQRPQLPQRPLATRLAAGGVAVLATSAVVFSQLGLAAMYSGQLDVALAARKAPPASTRVASAARGCGASHAQALDAAAP
jgi:hypothetical protein